MGLDMYLTKRHYVKRWNHVPKEEQKIVAVKRDKKKYPFINAKEITNIIEGLGYWRKANHIHMWFVEHCQNGVDECQETWVDPSKLKELLDTCKKVKEASELIKGDNDGKFIKDSTVAEELLPSQRGFFFGGTEYDEWYLQDIDDTIKMLETEFAIDYGVDQPEYYYRSSW